MEKLWLVLWLFLGAEIACAPPSAPKIHWDITGDSAGPVRFGMTPTEAAAALRLTLSDTFPSEGCDYWSPAGAPPGLSFMVENGRIVRVDADSPGVSTQTGLHVGSSVGDVRAAYGPSIRVSPHKYEWEAGWLYFSVSASDSTKGIVFEVDSHRVRTLRSGLWPPVGYVEHCS
jgi:hypothetical protein